MDLRAIYSAACFLLVVPPAAASAAQGFAHFPTYNANGWTVTDRGEERCHADFRIGTETVLSFMGPYYFRSGEPAPGSVIHLAEETHYMLPKGDKHGEFPVQLVAGTARFAVSGFATDLGGALVVDPGSLPTVTDLLAALPDEVTLSAMVEGKQVYAINLDGNRAAAKALQDCTAFIIAQKRPGTKHGPELGPPSMPPFEELPTRADPQIDAPSPVLPDFAPPSALPPSSYY